MDSVLAGLKWHSCIVHLDDSLVFSTDFGSHLQDLQTVFQRLRQYSHFVHKGIRYLVYVVTPHRLRVDPEKIDDVTDIEIPTNKSQLKAFLGLTSYYRRFLSSYAARVEPLL